jgi:hypothetical protein
MWVVLQKAFFQCGAKKFLIGALDTYIGGPIRRNGVSNGFYNSDLKLLAFAQPGPME